VSLAGLVVAVALMARSALRRATDSSARALLVALLGAGVVLLFAYQFTHALWLMYPYVYLGLLTAALERQEPTTPLLGRRGSGGTQGWASAIRRDDA
jgi:hypothetical protein